MPVLMRCQARYDEGARRAHSGGDDDDARWAGAARRMDVNAVTRWSAAP
jgi:hypothetical protein